MASKQPAPNVYELRPQKTIAAAVSAAAQHVNTVHAAAQQRGSSSKGK